MPKMAKTVFCLTLKDSDEDPLDLGGPCDIWDRHLYSDVAEQSCFEKSSCEAAV